MCCHRLAVTASGNNGLSASTLVDGRYTYQEVSMNFVLFPWTCFQFGKHLINYFKLDECDPVLSDIVFFFQSVSSIWIATCVSWRSSSRRPVSTWSGTGPKSSGSAWCRVRMFVNLTVRYEEGKTLCSAVCHVRHVFVG